MAPGRLPRPAAAAGFDPPPGPLGHFRPETLSKEIDPSPFSVLSLLSSGLFKVGDKPRLLAVDHLAGAKRITLLTRTAGGEDDRRVVVTWGDPKFYK